MTTFRKFAYTYRMERLARRELTHGDGRRLFLYGANDGATLPQDAPGGAWPALHLRHDALRDRWVAISPARNTRPQTAPTAQTPSDETPPCPLCVGGPELPFPYEAAVFENRFPTLLASPPTPPTLEGATAPSRGRCEVVLYTPTHTGSLATLSAEELARVVAIWTDRSAELFAAPDLQAVLVFENRGEDVGATLSHPHGQIYALDHLPIHLRERVDAIAAHRDTTGTCLHCDIVATDADAPGRHLVDNPSFTVGVPFAPDWPYEVHVRARRHGARRLTDLTTAERRDLAAALRDVVHVYDQLFDTPMAYLMACHQAPRADAGPVDDWHLSFEFLPPNRGPDKLKVRATVETAAGLFINDTVPETSAAQLREVATRTAGVTHAPIPDVEVVPEGTTAPAGT
ncbi:MAG: galactose-1-phosphate uridylyltransferase [Nitriliruptoraceae bacterium]|nr:galactose-1-phosphate uridylyltransferase [Nitriliruptoraceae bacterium]